MKVLPGSAISHLAGEVTTLAMCWRIARQDEVVMGFTDYHDDLVISDGEAGPLTYLAECGMVQATALTATADLGVDNTDMETVLCSDTIDREDLQAGKYDYAEVHIFVVNYLNPSAWQIKLLRGTIGEITVGKHRSTCELRSLTQRLKQRIGRGHEVSCPYELGDAKCGVNLEDFTFTGTVTAVINQFKFEDSSITEEDNYFKGGKLTWTGTDPELIELGASTNVGLSMEVKKWASGTNRFTLHLAMPFPIFEGDEYTVHAGCDKTYATCKEKFNNNNFGGFPFIPGQDFQLSFPDSRT
ncbi:MAG: DUF2163 domain-containing protein [Gammaproteobacteria bacterium]